MKKLTLVLSLLISSNLYSQTIQSNVNAAMVYDSIRALTEINDPSDADAYPWISPDGLRLYFIRGSGMTDNLMITDRTNTSSLFSTPVLVPLGVADPTSCWLSNDELNIYICKRDSLFFADRSTTSSAFNSPVLINLTGSIAYTYNSGVSLNGAQDKLFISLFTSLGTRNNAEFTRTSPTDFMFNRFLIPPVGFQTTPGVLSKDELTYYLGTEFNGGYTILYQVNRSTPADSFDLNTMQQIQGINDMLIDNFQPSMSDSLNWVVFVRNSSGLWEGNDLYIAQKGIETSVFNQGAKPIAFSLFPNPTGGQFTISLQSDNAELIIADLLGQEVLRKQIMQSTEKFQIENAGVYKVYVKTKQGMAIQKLIVEH